MTGEVAHALDVGAHVHRRDDHAQVGCDGLLASEQVDGEVVDLPAQRVDVVVGGDDALGDGAIALEQGGGGALESGGHHRRHRDELVGDLVEILVECVAHSRPPQAGSVERVQAWRMTTLRWFPADVSMTS